MILHDHTVLTCSNIYIFVVFPHLAYTVLNRLMGGNRCHDHGFFCIPGMRDALASGRFKMKIAIPVFHTKVSPRFDTTQGFILLDIEKRNVMEREKLTTKGLTSSAKIKQLIRLGVDTLICGGIDRESMQHLNHKGVTVYSWVTGEIDDAVSCFLENGMESGLILGSKGEKKGRWRFCSPESYISGSIKR